MKKLMDLRISQNKSTTEMAQLLGVTTQAYRNYENGTRKINPAALVKIAEYLGVTVDEILDKPTQETTLPMKIAQMINMLPAKRQQLYMELILDEIERQKK